MSIKLDGKEQHGEATTVSFRADKQACDDLDELAADVGAGVMGRRSVAIRRALREAVERKRAGSRKRS